MTTRRANARQGNTNRAVTRTRRALGKKRQLQSLAIRKVNREIRGTAPGPVDLSSLVSFPGMVTLPDGRVKFRPVRPVPLRRGKV